MKVTTQQMFNTLLGGINRQLRVQADGTEQVSTGRRFTRPSQDGLSYKTSLNLRHAESGIRASLDALAMAKSRLGIGQSMLSDTLPLIQRAQAVAIQMANAGISSADRQAAAVEIDALRDQALALANRKWKGSALFAGTATDVTPFSFDGFGNAVYAGNNQDRLVAITPTQTVNANVRGDHTAFTQMFSSMKALSDGLKADDTTAIGNAITSLNAAHDAMSELVAEVGSRYRAVELQQASYQDVQSQLTQRMNEHEAVDIAEVVARLSQSQTTLQAAYAEVSRLNNLSLVRFLQ